MRHTNGNFTAFPLQRMCGITGRTKHSPTSPKILQGLQCAMMPSFDWWELGNLSKSSDIALSIPRILSGTHNLGVLDDLVLSSPPICGLFQGHEQLVSDFYSTASE